MGNNKILAEKTFADCSLLSAPKDTTPPPPILWRKFLQVVTRPQNSRKFTPSKFFCYTWQWEIFTFGSLVSSPSLLLSIACSWVSGREPGIFLTASDININRGYNRAWRELRTARRAKDTRHIPSQWLSCTHSIECVVGWTIFGASGKIPGFFHLLVCKISRVNNLSCSTNACYKYWAGDWGQG